MLAKETNFVKEPNLDVIGMVQLWENVILILFLDHVKFIGILQTQFAWMKTLNLKTSMLN